MKDIIVYSKTICPYCVRAKELLKQKGLKFEEIIMDDPEELASLKKRTGMMTVPQIFIDGELIGGYQELQALNAEGKL